MTIQDEDRRKDSSIQNGRRRMAYNPQNERENDRSDYRAEGNVLAECYDAYKDQQDSKNGQWRCVQEGADKTRDRLTTPKAEKYRIAVPQHHSHNRPSYR